MKDKSLLPLAIPHGAHWAIEETAANQLMSILRGTPAAAHQAEFESRRDSDASNPGYDKLQDGVAFISLSGPLTKAPTSMDGGTSTVWARRLVRSAANDDEVKSIILVIDSPGGSVSGTEQLAADVAMAAKKKPCYAVVEDCCCSAAYWIASQSSAIYANETAMVGSIGTYMAIYDASRMFENAGVEMLVFKTGAKKGSGIFGTSITDEQRAAFQKTVDDLNSHFLSAVNRARGLNLVAGEGIADGGVLIGHQAVSAGLIDGIGSLDDVFQMCVREQKQSGRATRMESSDSPTSKISREDRSLAGLTLADETETALAAVSGLTARFADLKADRALEGRELSDKARSHIASIHAELEAALAQCRELLVSQVDASIRDQVARAVQDAELALAIHS